MAGPGAILRQERKQTFALVPQQRLGLHLLAMSLPDLRAELYREMEKNPCIEDIEQTLEKDTISQMERASEQEISREDDGGYEDWEESPEAAYTADADAIERREHFFDSQVREETLEEHLMKQLSTSNIPKADIPLAEILIGDLDGNGFFSGSIPDIMMVSGESEAKIREVLKKIGELDPPGCGATTAEECLLAQLDKLDGSPYRDEVREILEGGWLASLAKGDRQSVLDALMVPDDRLDDVLGALRTLEPRPGRAFAKHGKRIEYVKPEVHAVKSGGRWLAKVDDRSLPEIRISKHYLKMLTDPKSDAATQDFIRAKIAAAKELSDAVERRQETVEKIAQAIFDAQPGFFENGLKGLRPLTMLEIAEKTGVHHTTVSRTVNGKYASTPKGTVELRRFFATAVATAEGESVARDEVLDRIKALVEAEDRHSPLSDDALSAMLVKEGYKIARRTVAKYRDKLKIPSCRTRAIP